MFSARRSRVATVTRAGDPPDLDARFRALVQSPLRAGLLRHFFSRPGDTFTVEQLMQLREAVRAARAAMPDHDPDAT